MQGSMAMALGAAMAGMGGGMMPSMGSLRGRHDDPPRPRYVPCTAGTHASPLVIQPDIAPIYDVVGYHDGQRSAGKKARKLAKKVRAKKRRKQ